MGVGSTAIAALESDRKYIGYEISEKYVKLAMQRINSFESDILLTQKLNPKRTNLRGNLNQKKDAAKNK